MSQITSLVNAVNAAAKDKVPDMMDTVRPKKAQAPTGRGLSTRPVIVDRKIASNCHAWVDTATGLGTKYLTRSPTATDIAKGNGFAPFHDDSCLVGRAGFDVAASDSDSFRFASTFRFQLFCRIRFCLGLIGRKRKGLAFSSPANADEDESPEKLGRVEEAKFGLVEEEEEEEALMLLLL